MTARGLFITGTDSGVGKTVVTALLGDALRRRGIRAGAMKPVATGGVRIGGALRSPDALFLRDRLAMDDPIERVNPVCLREPLAPSVASRIEGVEVDLRACDAAREELDARYEMVLVEGVGGLLVPLSGAFTVADLALRWDLPLLVVGRPGLGTINHTSLTIRCAQGSGIHVAGFLFNSGSSSAGDPSEETNPSAVEELCRVPFWGSIPYGGPIATDEAAWRALGEAAERILGGRIDAFLAHFRNVP